MNRYCRLITRLISAFSVLPCSLAYIHCARRNTRRYVTLGYPNGLRSSGEGASEPSHLTIT